MSEHRTHDLFLWSDESILVINKPAGIPSLPHGYNPHLPHLRTILEPEFGRLWVVHRLDVDTSGVMVFARSVPAHRALNKLFAERQVDKKYHAFIVGEPYWHEMEVNLPLLPDADRRHRTVVDRRRGLHALTNFLVLERFNRYTLVEARPYTGRRHQIRVHLSAIGFPVVSDALYGSASGVFLSDLKRDYRSGKKPESPLLGRLGLHARLLGLEHPFENVPLFFEAPYPKDFSTLLKQCRKYAGKGRL